MLLLSFRSVLSTFFVTTIVTSPVFVVGDDTSSSSCQSIYDIVCSREDLVGFCDLIRVLGQEETLSSEDLDVTFFIPLTGIREAMKETSNDDLRSSVYQFHYTPGRLLSMDMNCQAGDNLITMMNGKDTR